MVLPLALLILGFAAPRGWATNSHRVTGGSDFTVVLQSDGTLRAWGHNDYGQLGDGTATDRYSPITVPNLTSVVSISAGARHVLALKSDGTVWAYGSGSSGQLGNGAAAKSYVPVQVGVTSSTPLTGIVAVAAGNYQSFAIKSDGTLWAWGSNNSGQLGDGTTSQRNRPVQVGNLSNIVAVASGTAHTLAVKSDGTVWTWGSNANGQLGNGTTTDHVTPVQLTSLSNITLVAAGDSHSLAVTKTGAVYAWGNNGSGRLGDNTTLERLSPVAVTGLTSGVVQVDAGVQNSYALKSDGTVLAWGDNLLGELGNNTLTESHVPLFVPRIGAVIAMASGWDHAVVVESSGAILCWGANDYGEMGNGQIGAVWSPSPVQGFNNIQQIAMGDSYTVVLNSNGTLSAWGDNTYGQLGDGTNVLRRVIPAPVAYLSGVTKIAVGARHTLALKSDGTVWAFGSGSSGQLGNGGAASSNFPVQVTLANGAALTNVTSIAAGDYHSFAIKSDGTLWAWGSNGSGRLGDGTTTQRNQAVQITALGTAVSAVAGGSVHSVALKTDGTVWAWGGNSQGQIGDGTTTTRNSPVRVGTLSGITSVAAGDSHTLALTSTGHVYSWGCDDSGRLGNGGGTGQLNSPYLITNLNNIAKIDAGVEDSMALTTTGTVYCWGDNQEGELGNGSWTQSDVPTLVPNLSSVSQITAGAYSLGVLKSDGTLAVWGGNDSGQLDNGTAETQLVPMQVSSLAIVIDTGDNDGDGLSNFMESRIGTNPNLVDTDGDGLSDSAEYGIPVDPVLSGSVTVMLLIDGGDRVHIKGNNLWIEHLNSALPNGATFNGSTFVPGQPCLVNFLSWSPTWTSANAGSLSNNYQSATPLMVSNPPQPLHFTLATEEGRGTTTFVQTPSAANNYEAIIELEDPSAGAAFYEFNLAWANIPVTGLGTNPLLADTDGDGMPDGWEVAHGLNPLDPSDAGLDPDHDGFTNLQEYHNGTDPHVPDGLTAATPTFSPSGGVFTSAQQITINCATSGATIFYTTDGSVPTTGSSSLSSGGTLSIVQSETVRAMAVLTGYSNSSITSAVYTIQVPAALPSFSPGGGIYSSAQTVVVTSTTPSAIIYYTTDGSAPTSSSPSVTSGASISVAQTETIQAIAMATGYNSSAVASAAYVILIPTVAPAFNPGTGTFSVAPTVGISSATAGATIYYTTDGSTPTTSSASFASGGSILVGQSEVIEAFALASGYANSVTASASYTVLTPAVTPTFNPPAGTYTSPQTVALNSATTGAKIYYTTDGSTPTTASPWITSGATIAVNASELVKAMTAAAGYNNSAVASASYVIQVPSAAPIFSPGGGVFTSPTTVVMSSSTPNSTIYYTLDGSVPTISSAAISSGGSISITYSGTLQALAVAPGYNNSAVTSAGYTIQIPTATPIFSPSAGTYTTAQLVTLSCSTAGATIYYTVDGTMPNTGSSSFTSSGTIHVPVSATLTMFAVAPGYNNSAVTSASYVIQVPAASPTFTPPPGSYTGTQTVTLASATGGCKIYYTTDGSTPTVNSPFKNSGDTLQVTSNETINAMTGASGYNNSPVVSATYTINVDADGNGLGDVWENQYFGHTGNSASAPSPNNSGLTLLQSFQQGLNPLIANVAAYSITLTAGGPYVAPVSTVTLAANVSSATLPVQRVDFYQGNSLLGSVAGAPYQFQMSNLKAGDYPVKAIAYDSSGAQATAYADFQVYAPASSTDSTQYVRGWGTDPNFLSSVYAVNFQQGVKLDGYSSTDFSNLYPSGLPWFLRTQAEANAPWYHITSTTSGSSQVYNLFNNPVLANGVQVGGAPPLVAFGSQGGGTALNINQNYSFGLVAGGQGNSANNPDIKVEVYQQSAFNSGGSKVAPIFTTTFTLPRTGSAAWTTYVNNGYVADYPLHGTYGGQALDFDTQVQYVPGSNTSTDDTWGQITQWPLLVTHRAGNSNFVYKISYMGMTIIGGNTGSPYAMAVDSTSSPTYNLSYTLDFSTPSPWQSSYITQPHFEGTALPSAYQGKSLDELIHNSPAVTDTLTVPTGTGLNLTGIDNSPELRSHPVLDAFIASMGNDPMALANYVLNEIDLTDAIGYNTGGAINNTSINPTGVSRDALATFLEGQGSPTEQCALLVYMLRKAGYPAAYVFPQQNGTLMFDQQLSKLLRMQINGAINDSTGTVYSTGSSTPTLIPVNYPWVATYINGQWVHIFPWLKDTSVTEGADLWSFMPKGYQTGAQWLQHYLLDDSTIRSLSTEDNPGTLFPLYVNNQLLANGSGTSLDQVGINIYNRRNYYTRWQDFPRPWSTQSVSNANLAQSLDVNQNPPALAGALQNIFDTINIQVFSDRNDPNGNDLYVSGDPVLNTGDLRMVDLHDRRFLLYHQVIQGTNPPQYNMTLSLEPFRPSATGQYSFTNDPGDLLNKQLASTTLVSTDDSLCYKIIYNRHLQAQAISGLTDQGHWVPYLGFDEDTTITDTRSLRKGDMACLCLDYGRVSPKMLEFQAEKYWAYQQNLQINPSATDPELANGQLLYIMGQSYYNKMSQFQASVEGWTKTHAVSWTAHGLTKLSPLRNADGTPNLISVGTNPTISDINLRYPRVDMSFQRAAWAGNGSSHLDSGAENEDAYGAAELMIGETSADEHRVINQFFNQSAAISTVKLLDLSQGSTPGSGVVTLTSANYQNQNTVYHFGGSNGPGNTLAGWNPALWAQVTKALSDPSFGPFTTVYMTPGPITATGQSGQSYEGMGAFILGVGDYGALISDNMMIDNGGYGGDAGYTFYEASPPATFSTAAVLAPTYDGGFSYYNTTAFTASSPSYAPVTYASSDVLSIDSGVSNSSQIITPDIISSIDQWGSSSLSSSYTAVGSTGSVSASAILALDNGGNLGSISVNNNMVSPFTDAGAVFSAVSNAIYDPVNAVTGEFYVNATDLKLNGPMPLEIQRTYGSLDQADNNFGHGWKLSYFPYLELSTDSAATPTLIYAAEMDGSVVAYRHQTSPSTRWIPVVTDNPSLADLPAGALSGMHNLYNNRIDQSTVGGTVIYTLTGADGSVRIFKTQSFPTGGSGGLTRTRPYLQSWTDNLGNSYTFSFGTVSTSVDYGQVNRINSSNGDFVGFNYDTYGHIVEAFTGDGRRLYYQYDTYGDLIQVTLPDASTISYQYQHLTTTTSGVTTIYSTHLITQETKPGGRVLQNSYDSSRRVATQLATVGTKSLTPLLNATFTYGTPTLVFGAGSYSGATSILDYNQNTTTYTYVDNQITKIKDPLNQTTTQTWNLWNAFGTGIYPRSLENKTDKRGLLTSYQYDAKGNMLQSVVQGTLTGSGSTTETATTTMTYNSTAVVTLPGGSSAIPNTVASFADPAISVSFTYGDAAHPYEPTTLVKSTTGGTISSEVRQYQNVVGASASAYGLLTLDTMASGSSDQAQVQYAYNSNGFITSETQFTGTGDPNVITTFTHNLRGELTSQTDAAGQNTQYTYDGRGNRTGEERYDAYGSLVDYHFDYYNQNGEIEWAQGARYAPNDYVYMQYDGAGRMTQKVQWRSAASPDGSGVQDNGNATTLNVYDGFGNLTETDSPNQNATTMTYDAIGQMLSRKVHTGANAGTVVAQESFTYEPGGLPAMHTDVLGGAETRRYTSTGELLSDLMPDGETKSYLYDLTGRVTKETLTNGSYWSTAYNDYTRTITRIFYNSAGTSQGTETQILDRRGNVISKTDLVGNVFTTTYDGLNRPVTVTGPPAAGSTAQQKTTHTYDAAGQVHVVADALGQKTITYLDAIGRPTLVMVRNYDQTVASNTGYWYSPDHQSVVSTVGSGAGGITTTTYTDTLGHPVLLRHADGTFQLTQYDANGNKTSFRDELGATTTWTYDALDHLVTQTLPASTPANAAVTTYTFNAAGELLTRAMPESLTEKIVYDTFGRKTSQELDGAGGTVTRKYLDSYWASNGSGGVKGLLQTVTDPRGFTTTTTYDAFLRPATVNSTGGTAQQNQNTGYTYDARGLLTQVAQSYAVGSTGPPTVVTRGYDAYGQLNAETVSVNGTTASQWTQAWNGAGHRSALNFQLAAEGAGTGNYAYQYNASGLLTQVGMDNAVFKYTYGDNNLLKQRASPILTSTVLSRDNRGRMTGETIFGLGQTLTSETQTWRSDERLNTYSISGVVVHPESRTYGYDVRGRLTSEPYVLSNSTPPADLPNGAQTAVYAFDQTTLTGPSVEGGLGIRTEQHVNVNTGYLVNTQNNVKQATQDNILPGDGSSPAISFAYDAAGNVTSKSVTGQSLGLSWDSYNRLVGVTGRDSSNNGYNWTTVYDGLGRRVETTYQAVSANSPTGPVNSLTYYYDPQVEFLELGLLDGTRQWKVYGPDRNGVYGGLEGCGGLDAVVDETSGNMNGSLNNFFGDSVGQANLTNGGGFGLALGGYGAMPGSGLPDITPMWRGHYLDWTQFYSMGARYYDPSSGRFLSADPLGHAATMDLYSYCNGDPVNGLDPDGRFGKGGFEAGEQAITGTASLLSNVGGTLGYGVTSLFSRDYANEAYGSQLQGLQNTLNGIGTLATQASNGDFSDIGTELTGGANQSGAYRVGYAGASIGLILAGGEFGEAGQVGEVENTLTAGGRAAVTPENGLASFAAEETPQLVQMEFPFARGAAIQTPGVTAEGETFVRVGAAPYNLKFGSTSLSGAQPGTYAFPQATFDAIGENPAALKNLGDLPGAPPTYFRTLSPPAGTPIQRGIVPGGEFGGQGGAGEVIFPEGF